MVLVIQAKQPNPHPHDVGGWTKDIVIKHKPPLWPKGALAVAPGALWHGPIAATLYAHPFSKTAAH